LVAYHLLTAYADNLATAYDLTPGEIDAASFASLLGGLLAALWLVIGTIATPFLMQGLICSGSPISGGGGTALQQLFALQQIAAVMKTIKTGGAAAPAVAAQAATKSGGGNSGGGPGIAPPSTPPPVAPPPPSCAGTGVPPIRAATPELPRRSALAQLPAHLTPRSEIFHPIHDHHFVKRPRLMCDPTPAQPAGPVHGVPSELFADHAMAARLWCVVALIAVTLCALQPFLVIRAYRERERVIVLDPERDVSRQPAPRIRGGGQAARAACAAGVSRVVPAQSRPASTSRS
jgi:hypothetical protein